MRFFQFSRKYTHSEAGKNGGEEKQTNNVFIKVALQIICLINIISTKGST